MNTFACASADVAVTVAAQLPPFARLTASEWSTSRLGSTVVNWPNTTTGLWVVLTPKEITLRCALYRWCVGHARQPAPIATIRLSCSQANLWKTTSDAKALCALALYRRLMETGGLSRGDLVKKGTKGSGLAGQRTDVGHGTDATDHPFVAYKIIEQACITAAEHQDKPSKKTAKIVETNIEFSIGDRTVPIKRMSCVRASR